MLWLVNTCLETVKLTSALRAGPKIIKVLAPQSVIHVAGAVNTSRSLCEMQDLGVTQPF